jgi:flagellar motor protein MotB
VKQFLIKRFHLQAEAIETIGFGWTELKDAADPFAAENRRVQIVSGGLK